LKGGMSKYVEVMIELENDMLTDEEEALQMHSEIKNDSTNVMSIEDLNRSASHAYKQETNSSFNFIGD